ncbi:hypothetical protein ACQEU3_47180 [Spirillospora sp. CA-253888]
MTEIDIRKDTTPTTAAPAQPEAAPQMSALAQWAIDANQAYQIAVKLAGTSFVPTTMRNKPDDLTACILTGQELGLPPMAALRAMDVIQGIPALRAHAMRGLVQSNGHEIELVESDDKHCVMRGRRKGSATWQTVTWTTDRAAQLQLVGKGEWKKQPTTMLIARATGEICRLIASDVLYAAPYAAEELSDDGRPEPVVSAPVTRAEVLGETPPVEESEPDPDAEAAAQHDAEVEGLLAEEVDGWPQVRKPGGGA